MAYNPNNAGHDITIPPWISNEIALAAVAETFELAGDLHREYDDRGKIERIWFTGAFRGGKQWHDFETFCQRLPDKLA